MSTNDSGMGANPPVGATRAADLGEGDQRPEIVALPAGSPCTCAQCAACLLRALADMPDAIDRICAEPPERLVGLRGPIIERLRADRITWRAKREEKE